MWCGDQKLQKTVCAVLSPSVTRNRCWRQVPSRYTAPAAPEEWFTLHLNLPHIETVSATLHLEKGLSRVAS